jgi:hypothetical protein
MDGQVGKGAGVWPWLKESGLTLGMGFDTLRCEACATALTGNIVAIPPDEGQTSSYNLEIVEDEYEFLESLQISASASFKGFGYEAGAEYNLQRQVEIHRYSVFLIACVRVTNGQTRFDGPQFTQYARQTYDNAPPDQHRMHFARTYGDSFVSAITWGGELFAAFSFSASSESMKQTITASISASIQGLVASGSGSAAFQDAINEIRKHHSTVLVVDQRGGNNPPPDLSIDAIVTAAKAFPASVHGHATEISFYSQRYERVPTPGQTIPTEATAAEDSLDRLAKARSKLVQLQSDLRFVKANLAMFAVEDTDDIDKRLDDIDDSIHQTGVLASNLAQHRYDQNLSPYTHPGTAGMRPAPKIPSGKRIPGVFLNVVSAGNGHGTEIKPDSDGWYRAGYMLSFMIGGITFPAGTTLKYKAHRADIAWTDDTPLGAQTAAGNNAYLQGIKIWVEGPEASRYQVFYRVLDERGNVWDAQDKDGALAGTTGMYRQIVAIKFEIWFA